MGPRFCKRGNKPTRSGDNVILLLQWGHAFVSVETAQGDGQRQPGHQVLQWGHAFVSVETYKDETIPKRQRAASMGPRFCKRGNQEVVPCEDWETMLQWGHAFVSVETTTRPRSPISHRCFNGATLL